MQNLAGRVEATRVAREELQAAGIPVVEVDEAWGEVPSLVEGQLGPFRFRRTWVYWCVDGQMSREHAEAINDEPFSVDESRPRYAGYRGTWGDVVRAEGFSGGQEKIDEDGCNSWHVDTLAGLIFFASTVRRLGLDHAKLQ